jgi:hypothetical protein
MPSRIAYFQSKAAEAQKEAQQSTDPHERRKLLTLSRACTKIAEQAERLWAETDRPERFEGTRRNRTDG